MENPLKFLFIALIALICYCSATAQHKKLWEERYGGGKAEYLYSVIETFHGNIVSVGESKTRSEGKKDFYILMAHPDGREIYERKLGRARDDGAYGVVQTWDGGYIVVGYTDSEGRGQRDPVVLKVDENLGDIWAKLEFGTPGFDQCNDIIRLANIGYVVCGLINNQLWIFKIDESGKKVWDFVLPDYTYSEANAIVELKSGNLAITGRCGQKKDQESNQLIFLMLSPDGEIISSILYNDEGLYTGEGIVELENGDIAITGICYSKRYKEDMGLLMLDRQGVFKFFRPYDGVYGDEGGQAITVDYSGDIYLGGYATVRGGRRESGWINHVNRIDGNRIWKRDEKNYFGGEKEDRITDIIHTTDGSILMCGYTTRTLKSKQGWLYKLEPEIPEEYDQGAIDLTMENIHFSDPDGNGILTSNERSYISLEVYNGGSADAYHVKIDATLASLNPGINFLSGISVGRISAGERRKITIPVYGNQISMAGISDFDLTLYENSNVASDLVSFQISNDIAPQPKLDIENIAFKPLQGESFYRNARIFLTMQLANNGNSAAKRVQVHYALPTGVSPISPLNLYAGDIEINGRVPLQFEFKPQFAFFKDTVTVQFNAIDSTTNFFVDTILKLPLEKIPIDIIRQPRILSIEWDGQIDSNIVYEVKEDLFGIRARLISNKPFEIDSIHILQNDDLTTGYTMDLEEVPVEDTSEFEQYVYRLSARLLLQEGENRIQVSAGNVVGRDKTSEIKVHFDPVKPNLHILSIGVPLEVKKFGPNDAQAFVQAFTENSRQYFDSVYVTEKWTRNTTFRNDLTPAFLDIKRKYRNKEILPEDVLLVFISSHATINTPKTFKIKASNFDGFTPDITSIDFEDIVERFLKQVNCQKIVFLDVFNETSEIDEEDEDAGNDDPLLSKKFVEMIKSNQITTPVILSCSPDESSYEDAEIEKGIFAESIFRVLQSDQKAITDANKNNIITISELFTSIRDKTSELRKLKIQTPYFEERQRLKDIDLLRVPAFKN